MCHIRPGSWGSRSIEALNLCRPLYMMTMNPSSTISSSLKCSRSCAKKSSSMDAGSKMKRSVYSRAVFSRSGRSEARKSATLSMVSSVSPAR